MIYIFTHTNTNIRKKDTDKKQIVPKNLHLMDPCDDALCHLSIQVPGDLLKDMFCLKIA